MLYVGRMLYVVFNYVGGNDGDGVNDHVHYAAVIPRSSAIFRSGKLNLVVFEMKL